MKRDNNSLIHSFVPREQMISKAIPDEQSYKRTEEKKGSTNIRLKHCMRLSRRVHRKMTLNSGYWMRSEHTHTHSAHFTSLHCVTCALFVSHNLIYWNCSFFIILFIYWQTHLVHRHFINTKPQAETDRANGRADEREWASFLMFGRRRHSLPFQHNFIESVFHLKGGNGKQMRYTKHTHTHSGTTDKANTSTEKKIYMKHYLYYSWYTNQTVSNEQRIKETFQNQHKNFIMFELFFHSVPISATLIH